MRVGVVCPYDLGEPGGVQQICHELAEQLRSSGDSVVVVGAGSRRLHGGPGRDDDTVRVGRSFKIRANQSSVPLTLSPMSWTRLRGALADVDVVHLHEPMVPLTGWAGMQAPKPMVMTFHADAPNWVEMTYRWAPLVGSRMRSSVLTAVSESAKRGIPTRWGEVRIIPNAIEVAAYDLPVGRVPRRIAFLGRDDPRKGLDIALEAFMSIKEDHPDVQLLVMGAERDVVIPGVRFLGRISDGEKLRLLASSAIYVAPNTGGESFGIVLVEAMAAGCAVVASNLPAFRSVVGENGILFPVGDAAALAREVSRLLADEARRELLGRAGREAVMAYDWSSILDMYKSAYAHALDIR